MTETMWRCDQVRAGRLYNRMMFDTREEAEQFVQRMQQMEPDRIRLLRIALAELFLDRLPEELVASDPRGIRLFNELLCNKSIYDDMTGLRWLKYEATDNYSGWARHSARLASMPNSATRSPSSSLARRRLAPSSHR